MAKRKRLGNGAREVLLKYFGSGEARICDVDHMLAWLWVEGFIVKPLDATRDRTLLTEYQPKKRKSK